MWGVVPVRSVFCVLLIAAVGCGSSGGSSPSDSQPGSCTTGTEVVLVKPVPGTTVSAGTKTLKIASSAGIAYGNTALLAESTAGGSSGPFPLVGPVKAPRDHSKSIELWGTPTPSPTPPPTPTPEPTAPVPFPSPVYYAAHGFGLQPGQTYLVEVVRTDSSCRPHTIRNAQFNTASK